MHCIQRCALTRFDVDLDRHRRFAGVHARALRSGCSSSRTATGASAQGSSTRLRSRCHRCPSCRTRFERELADQIIGASPFAWVNRLERPRGGRIQDVGLLSQRRAGDVGPARPDPRPAAVQAARRQRRRVPAYASGWSSISPTNRSSRSTPMRVPLGSRRSRSRSGHPDLDLGRSTTQARPGHRRRTSACLMADANEAWAPKEAIRRLHAFHDAGVPLYWIEDPCLRDDFDGLRSISRRCRTCWSTPGST